MLKEISTPFFEIGPKAYLYGKELLDLAIAAEQASLKHDVPVIFTVPPTEISFIAAHTKHLLVFAQHMDWQQPGRGMGKVIPEAVKNAGAKGVMLNHSEQPMTFSDLKHAIDRAREVGLYSIVCADSVQEAAAIAGLSPDMIVAEPAANIGTGRTCDPSYIEAALTAIKSVNPSIKVLLAAGIKSPDDVYHMIHSGADATGSTSGILMADDPLAMVDLMLAAVRKAWNDRL